MSDGVFLFQVYVGGLLEIMQQLPSYARQSFPIEIHFKSAISRHLLDYLLIQVQQGTKPYENMSRSVNTFIVVYHYTHKTCMY